MSPTEALMWRLEADPQLASTFGAVALLDRPCDMEVLRDRLARAATVVPRLRQRVQEFPGTIRPPRWVEDPSFDIAHHVHHLVLPRPVSLRALFDAAAGFVAAPFDPSRPLWEFVVVDGLRNGRGALIQKIHHAVADGEAVVAMSLEFLDLERRPPARIARAVLPPFGQAAPPTGALVQAFRDLVAQPERLGERAAAAVGVMTATMRQLSEGGPARSPIWTARSTGRHLEVLTIDLEAAKTAARRLGGTLNALLMCATADSAGRYHAEAGAPVEELRASMAVSTRTEASGANAFSLARLLVPTGPMAARDRFEMISATTNAARQTVSTASFELLAALSSPVPTPIVTRLARQQAQSVDFATSNVKGPPLRCYVGGAEILAQYPLGPLGGVAFNLTMMSYNGRVQLGLHCDPAAITAPDRLRQLLTDAARRIIRAAPSVH